MRLKDGVIFTNVAEETIVVTANKYLSNFINLKGMIKLNATGAFIAQNLLQQTTKEDLVALLRKEYEIDEETAVEAVESIVEKFQSVGLMTE